MGKEDWLEEEVRREYEAAERERVYRPTGAWTCPVCGDVLGAGLAYCEGLLLDDEDGGDCRHERVEAPWMKAAREYAHAARAPREGTS